VLPNPGVWNEMSRRWFVYVGGTDGTGETNERKAESDDSQVVAFRDEARRTTAGMPGTMCGVGSSAD
jgi:hypothetical protein